jgi:hypothetical protein
MIEYIVVIAEEHGTHSTAYTKELEYEVNRRIRLGYEPVGGLAVRTGSISGALLMQAMIKNEPVE